LEGGEEMIEKKFLKGHVFQYQGDPTVYWEVPSPEVFGKYSGDWGLIQKRERPGSKEIEKLKRKIEELKKKDSVEDLVRAIYERIK